VKISAIFIIIFSLSILVVSYYYGWINDIYFFGRNNVISWLNGYKVSISDNSSVTVIKSGQYAYSLLSQVTIPDNITTIEQNAFIGNMLTNITIGENVTLAKDAFGDGFETFYANNKKSAGTYTRISHFTTQWTSWFGDFSYVRHNDIIIITRYAGSGGDVIIPAVLQGGVVAYIGEDAFYGAGITTVSIPQNVISIEDGAFSFNRLTSVYIPSSMKSIGVDAFANNPITRVSLGANVYLRSNNNNHGILGQASGFNSAYITNNRSRAGTYSRQNVNSTTWSRTDTPAPAVNTPSEPAPQPVPPTTREYKVLDIGPAGGYVFYDKGRYTNGWRYLEAAPASSETIARWGLQGISCPGTNTSIGSGRANTSSIINLLNSNRERGCVAQICAGLTINGFNDWFLPSRDELNLMYQNLDQRGYGGFKEDWYMSSSVDARNSSGSIWDQHFGHGRQGNGTNPNANRTNECLFRAIRAF